MTSSLSDLVGQELTWVRPAVFQLRYNLIAPDNSVIATFPVGKSGWLNGRHRLKALVPSGTLFPDGTLFLYQDWKGEDVAISAVEQGPRLATYERPWLVFPDGREFLWGNTNKLGTQKGWIDSPRTTAYVQLSVESIIERKFPVDIYPPAAEIPELSLLLVLGLYNILIEDREAMNELGGIVRGGVGWGISH